MASKKRRFSVTGTSSFDFDVFAEDEEDAREMAVLKAGDNLEYDNIEVYDEGGDDE